MRNREKNGHTPRKLQNPSPFPETTWNDLHRVFKNYSAEHMGAIQVAGTNVQYSLNESRGLACKLALFTDNELHYFEAIDRVKSTIELLSGLMEKEPTREQRQQLNNMLQTQLCILGLFTWLEAYGPRFGPDESVVYH